MSVKFEFQISIEGLRGDGLVLISETSNKISKFSTIRGLVYPKNKTIQTLT